MRLIVEHIQRLSRLIYEDEKRDRARRGEKSRVSKLISFLSVLSFYEQNYKFQICLVIESRFVCKSLELFIGNRSREASPPHAPLKSRRMLHNCAFMSIPSRTINNKHEKFVWAAFRDLVCAFSLGWFLSPFIVIDECLARRKRCNLLIIKMILMIIYFQLFACR